MHAHARGSNWPVNKKEPFQVKTESSLPRRRCVRTTEAGLGKLARDMHVMLTEIGKHSMHVMRTEIGNRSMHVMPMEIDRNRSMHVMPTESNTDGPDSVTSQRRVCILQVPDRRRIMSTTSTVERRIWLHITNNDETVSRFPLTQHQVNNVPYLKRQKPTSKTEEESEPSSPLAVISLTSATLNPSYATTVLKYAETQRPKHLFTYLPRGLDPAELFRQLDNLDVTTPLTAEFLRTNTASSSSPPTFSQSVRKNYLTNVVEPRLKDVRNFRDYPGYVPGGKDYGPTNRPRARDAAVEMCIFAQKFLSAEDDYLFGQSFFACLLYVLDHSRTFNYGSDGADGINMDLSVPGLLVHHTVKWALSDGDPLKRTKKQIKVLETTLGKNTSPEFEDYPDAGSSSGGSDSSDSGSDESDSDSEPSQESTANTVD